MPEIRRPTVGTDALAEWCTRWLGAPPAAELFGTGYLSAVNGLRLADGREVVVKVRPSVPRLAGCAVVHLALWRVGFPSPEPLADLQPLNGYAASAEVLVPDVDDPPEGELAALSAAALARLVALAPSPGSVPSLSPSPSWVGWDHTEPGLWPRAEDRDVDLNAYPAPQWLDRVAAAVRDRLSASTSDPVIGHGDWHPQNLRWQGSELIAVHDWDSVICQPEPAIAGFAPVSFLGIDAPAPPANVDDSAAFLDAHSKPAAALDVPGHLDIPGPAASWAPAGAAFMIRPCVSRCRDATDRVADGRIFDSRSDAMVGHRLVIEARDDMQVGVEPALIVPAERVPVGREPLV